MNEAERVLVIGGGSAGIMAALSAAGAGGRVVLLEKNRVLGRKLLLTGNGRCNLTNQADLETLVAMMPGNGRFLYGAFSRFGPEELCAFFSSLGLATKTETDGRVFPASGRAGDVLAALERALAGSGVDCRIGERVIGLALRDGRINGVETPDGPLRGRAAIVATGGMTYPATGSTGDGYGLAAVAGHRIVPPRPSLVPLAVAEPWAAGLQGLSLDRVSLTLLRGGTVVSEDSGEFLFTGSGISGPAVLRISRAAVPYLLAGEKIALALDLLPETTPADLETRVRADLAQNSRCETKNAFGLFIPGRLRALVLSLAGIPPDKPAHQITRAEREGLCRLVKDLRLTLTGFRPIAEAIVTAGGVAVDEVSPRTMASRIVHGLYFAGEVLDVDGYTGGFNLQAAFGTGYLAGEAAALGRE